MLSYNAWKIAKSKRFRNKLKFIVDGLNGPFGVQLVKEVCCFVP
jgi:hypothetical protein